MPSSKKDIKIISILITRLKPKSQKLIHRIIMRETNSLEMAVHSSEDWLIASMGGQELLSEKAFL
jgi:hypothetical protein